MAMFQGFMVNNYNKRRFHTYFTSHFQRLAGDEFFLIKVNFFFKIAGARNVRRRCAWLLCFCCTQCANNVEKKIVFHGIN